MKRVVIAGGGTGGHIFAAIALAEYLKKASLEPILVGSKSGMEKEIFPAYPYDYYLLQTSGFAGRDPLNKIKSLLGLTVSTTRCLGLFGSIRPVFCLGFGGYTSLPVIVASRILGIKSGILEQNAVMGKANRFLSHFSDYLFLNFPSAGRDVKHPNKIVTGNPVREEIFRINRKSFDGKLSIGVLGGSRGARSINNAMIQWAQITKLDVDVILQTGREDFERVRELIGRRKPTWRVVPFIDDMVSFYGSIDFIICRSGASTLSEIACARLGSMLVPYPYAIYDHQYYNALEYERAGAAVLIKDKNLSGKIIETVVSSLNGDRLRSMSESAGRLCKRDACEKILSVIIGGITQ